MEQIVKVNHVDNLPTKCGGDVEEIEKNIAFWIFLILFALVIAVDILLTVKALKKERESDIERAVRNDGMEVFSNVQKTENVKTEENKKIKSEEITVEIKENKLIPLMINNFKILHPLSSIMNNSILSPLIFTSWIFLYYIFNIFGFNALYFSETMLEDRIYDMYRDNFGYPMKTEFEKIMSEIATAIALNIIVRAIVLVTYQQKEELQNRIQTNKEIKTVIKEFSKSMMIIRIISGVFMLALSVFFFYYCVVFCGIYKNAQYGWFYSGIWGLFWSWVVFAHLYIVSISFIEYKGNEICAYYMKRLFFF